MCKATQTPILKIGSTVHVGDWTGTVKEINQDTVVLILDSGRRLTVDNKLIEDAITEIKA